MDGSTLFVAILLLAGVVWVVVRRRKRRLPNYDDAVDGSARMAEIAHGPGSHGAVRRAITKQQADAARGVAQRQAQDPGARMVHTFIDDLAIINAGGSPADVFAKLGTRSVPPEIRTDELKDFLPCLNELLDSNENAKSDFRKLVLEIQHAFDRERERAENFVKKANENADTALEAQSKATKLRNKLDKSRLFLASLGSLIEPQVKLSPLDLDCGTDTLGEDVQITLSAYDIRQLLSAYWDMVADEMEGKMGIRHGMTNADHESVGTEDYDPPIRMDMDGTFRLRNKQDRVDKLRKKLKLVQGGRS
jgi:hypothetical protein